MESGRKPGKLSPSCGGGEAANAAELAEKLAPRGYDEATYTTALEWLADKGWISPGDPGYEITPEGSTRRQQAEDETNRRFFTPWGTLSNLEKTRLRWMLVQLKVELTGLAESQPVPA